MLLRVFKFRIWIFKKSLKCLLIWFHQTGRHHGLSNCWFLLLLLQDRACILWIVDTGNLHFFHIFSLIHYDTNLLLFAFLMPCLIPGTDLVSLRLITSCLFHNARFLFQELSPDESEDSASKVTFHMQHANNYVLLRWKYQMRRSL